MAELQYRFISGKRRFSSDQPERAHWEVWQPKDDFPNSQPSDGDAYGDWVRVDEELAKLLEGYTEVEQGPNGPVFSGEGKPPLDADTLEAAYQAVLWKTQLAKFPWWTQPVVDAYGFYTSDTSADEVAAARAYAEQLNIPGSSGATTQGQGRIVPGESVGGPAGSWFIQDPDGTVRPYTPPKAHVGQGRIVPGVSVGAPSGTWFLQQPDGSLTPYTPPQEPSPGLTFAEAVNFIGNRAERPEEFTRWIEALMRGPDQPTTLAGFPRQLGGASEQATTTATGFTGGVGPFGGPFPAPLSLLPPGGTPTNPAGVAPGPFTQAIQADLQVATERLKSDFQAALGSPEKFDPNYENASPEAQAAIRAEAERLQAQTTAPVPAPTAKTFEEAVAQATPQQTETEAEPDESVYRAYDPDYETASEEAKAAIRAAYKASQQPTTTAVANPQSTDTGLASIGPGFSISSGFALASPGFALSQGSSPGFPTTPRGATVFGDGAKKGGRPSLTFEEALAEIRQKDLTQQALRQRGRTIFR